VETVPMDSIKSIHEALKIAKTLYQELSSQPGMGSAAAGGAAVAGAAHVTNAAREMRDSGPGVGKLERGNGAGFGEAPLSARPQTAVHTQQPAGLPGAPPHAGALAAAQTPTAERSGEAVAVRNAGGERASADGSGADGPPGPQPSGDRAGSEKRTLPKPAAFAHFKSSTAHGQQATSELKAIQAEHKHKSLEAMAQTRRVG
jgi:hypothetical protein